MIEVFYAFANNGELCLKSGEVIHRWDNKQNFFYSQKEAVDAMMANVEKHTGMFVVSLWRLKYDEKHHSMLTNHNGFCYVSTKREIITPEDLMNVA